MSWIKTDRKRERKRAAKISIFFLFHNHYQGARASELDQYA